MARRLTVVQALPALDSGGVERGTVEVAAALVAAGHRALVLSAGGPMVQALSDLGAEHVPLAIGTKSPLTLRHVPRVRQLLCACKADIVHVRSRMPGWVVWWAWRGMPASQRPRLVTTVHGLYSVGRYSSIMTRGERVIAVSETVRVYLARHYPALDPARIEVIPRGVDGRVYRRGYRPSSTWLQAWRAQCPELEGRRVLTLPGRLTRLKGHHEFLDLIGSLAAGGLPVHGLIVGGEGRGRAGYAGEVRARVKRDRLPVTLLGNRTDLREVLAVSDLVLSLSTRPESFGRTTLEALALGVPVVGYAHGGVGEILDAMFPAGRVPREDGDALLRRCTALLEGEAIEIAPNVFALERMLERTLALYQALCAAPRA